MARIGPYEVVRELGRGGAGVVLHARAPDGRDVALKLLLHPKARAQIPRFERERRLLASLGEADGFVALLGAGDSTQGPYVVMPLVSGGALRDRMRNGPFSIEDVVALGEALATAIGRAHARGIVHRDLKPENVLFTAAGDSEGEALEGGARSPPSSAARQYGMPLIADLGLAKHFGDSGGDVGVSLSRTGELRGTPGFMSPEQMNDAKSAGPQADVFALGAVLYECLTGAPAFEGDTDHARLGAVAEGRFTPVRLRRHDAPAWLASVIERAIVADPAARFQNGDELAAALAAAGPIEPPRAPVLKIALVVSLVACALGIVGGIAFWRVRAERARLVAELAARIQQERLEAERRRLVEDERTRERAAAAARDERKRESRALASAAIAKLNKNGGDRSALQDLDRAIELDPEDASALLYRGVGRFSMSDYRGAIADLDRAIELRPNELLAFSTRGLAREVLDQHDGARADFRRAFELDAPSAAGNLKSAALAAGKNGDPERSLRMLGWLVDLAPRDASAWVERARARAARGDGEGALQDLDHAVEVAPDSALALKDRAELQRRRGEVALSLRDYDRSLELAEDPSVRLDRSVLRFETGDLAGARADVDRLVQLDAKNAMALGFRGMIRPASERDAAIADLEKALAIGLTGEPERQAREGLAKLKSAR